MNVSKKLLCVSLLLSAPVALQAMDKTSIVENYKSGDLSTTIVVHQADAAQKQAANLALQASAQIIKEFKETTQEQENLAAQYQTIVEWQDEAAQRDFELQSRRAELRKKYTALHESLPIEQRISLDNALELPQGPILVVQEEATKPAETAKPKSSWWPWGN